MIVGHNLISSKIKMVIFIILGCLKHMTCMHIIPLGKFHRIGGAPSEIFFVILSMMPLKRLVVTENVLIILLGN